MSDTDVLSVTTSNADGRAVVSLRGDLDLGSVAFLRNALAKLGEVDETILDLAELEFMDSTGLGALVHYARRLKAGSRLVISAPRPNIRRLFSITELDRLFEIVDERP